MTSIVVEKGTRIIGFWGAMFPWSYGTITKIEGADAHIKWDKKSEGKSIEPVDKFKTGAVNNGIGLYIQ